MDARVNILAPELVIGLGQTGCEVASLLRAHLRQTYPVDQTRLLRTVGIDFVSRKAEEFDAYIQLSDDIAGMLRRVSSHAPHIRTWLNVDEYESLPLQPPWPRPLERLALFDDVRLGSRSRLLDSLSEQIALLKEQQRSLTVSVVAALAEPAAGSILIDILHIIRQLAEAAGRGLLRWAHLILPAAQGGDEVRAFATLRELSRLMCYNNADYGEPMYYYADENTTLFKSTSQNRLTHKPADQIFLFEQPLVSAAELANIILVCAEQRIQDRFRANTLNQPDRSPETLMVNALGGYSFTLPVQRLVEVWTTKHALQTLERWLPSSRPPAQVVDKVVESLFVEPALISLGRELLTWQNEERAPLAERLVRARSGSLDRLLFSDHIIQLLEVKHIEALRFDDDLASLKSSNIFGRLMRDLRQEVDICDEQSRERLKQYFGATEANRRYDGGQYRVVLNKSAAHYVTLFHEALTKLVRSLLNDSADVYLAQEALKRLEALLAHGCDTLKQAVESNEGENSVIGDASEIYHRHALPRLYRSRAEDNRSALRDAIESFTRAYRAYLNALRTYHLLYTLQEVVSDMLVITQNALEWLDRWAAVLLDASASLLNRCRTLDAVFYHTENQYLIEDDAWLDQKYHRAIEKAGGAQWMAERLQWHVGSSDGIEPGFKISLEFDGVNLFHRDQQNWQTHNLARWLEVAVHPFEDFKVQAQVLHYLYDSRQFHKASLCASQLRKAEDQMLSYTVRGDSQQRTTGFIAVGPTADMPDHSRYVQDILAVLSAVQGSPIIERIDVHDPYRLSYLTLSQLINLVDEVPRYATLESHYEEHQDQRNQEHVFSAERWAVFYENKLSPPRYLHPLVVNLLAYHEAFLQFLRACAFNLVMLRSSGPGKPLVYWLELPDERVSERRRTWSLGASPIKAFQVYTAGGPTGSPPIESNHIETALAASMLGEVKKQRDALLAGKDSRVQHYLNEARKRGYEREQALLAVWVEMVQLDAYASSLGRAKDEASGQAEYDFLELSVLILQDTVNTLEQRVRHLAFGG